MNTENLYTQILNQLVDSLPTNLQAIKKELETYLQGALKATISKLNLVSQEEFDIQKENLLSAQLKLEHLDKIIQDLEFRINNPSSTH
ncbi:MAG: hypothetical protein JWM09_275 [Francisellaceae bacterium]|nr:hypothetical protein [Francisellaceae bacterium]